LFSTECGPSVDCDYFLPRWFERSNTYAADYCSKDTVRAALLWVMYWTELHNQGLWDSYLREQSLLPAVYQMETYGMRLRPKTMTKERNRYAAAAESAKSTVSSIASRHFSMPNFNMNSYPQRKKLLFDHFNLPVAGYTESGDPSTRREFLEETLLMAGSINDKSAVKVLRAFVVHGRAEKSVEDLDAYLEESVLQPEADGGTGLWYRPHWNPWGAATTRFSASRAQNVRKRGEYSLRVIFGPQSGFDWISCDYTQLEVRIMATASGDKRLNELLDTGGDVHQNTADAFGIPRDVAKNVYFAWQYGGGVERLTTMAGMSAAEFNTRMRLTYPGVVAYKERITAEAGRNGFVKTLFGYRLSTPPDRPYAGIDYVIQGTAGDILKNAMIAAYRAISEVKALHRIRMFACIHDEILFAVPSSTPAPCIKTIQRILESAGGPIGCRTPVSVKRIRDHWGNPVPYRFTRRSLAR